MSEKPQPTHLIPPPFPPVAMRVPVASQVTGIPQSTLWADISAGRLRAKKHGRSTLITWADLQDYIDALPYGSEPGEGA